MWPSHETVERRAVEIVYLQDGQRGDGEDTNGDQLSVDQRSVHLQPAVVEAAVVLVLEAHAEEDDDEGTTPSDAGVLQASGDPRLNKNYKNQPLEP